MNKFLKTFLAGLAAVLLFPTMALAAAGDIKMDRKNSTDTAWISTIFAKANSSFVGLDSSGVPTMVSNITWVAGTTTGQLIHPVGAAATPSITFLGNTDMGFYWSASNRLGIAMAGVASGRIEANGSGGIYYAKADGLSYLGLPSTGGVDLVAGGTNQNVTATPSGTGKFFVGAAVSTNPQIALATDTDTGIVWFGADQIGINIGGSRMLSFGAVATNAISVNGTATFEFGVTARAKINVSADTTAGNLVFTGTTTGNQTFTIANGSMVLSNVGGTGLSWKPSTVNVFYDNASGKTVAVRASDALATMTFGDDHTVTQNGALGAATTGTRLLKSVTGIANNTATDIITVTVPNAAHSATLKVTLTGSLGAGGAIGANEATGTTSFNVPIARTAGVATVPATATAYAVTNTNVAGAATITVTYAISAISGAVGATQTFTVTVTIARGSGSSTNHTCLVDAEILNANATGITIS